MRGAFGRSRLEKPQQPGLLITSYDDALYPPRAYRYHVQQAVPPLRVSPPAALQHAPGTSWTVPTPALIVLPSIDADSICEPHAVKASSLTGPGGSATTPALTPATTSSGLSAGAPPPPPSHALVMEKKAPPQLRQFVDCFVPSASASEDMMAFQQVMACREPLNVFHYPQLLRTASDTSSLVKPPPSASSASPRQREGTRQQQQQQQQAVLNALADQLGLPTELRGFAAAAGADGTVSALERLRIRPFTRPPAPRPVRRGAKVTLMAVSEASAAAYAAQQSSRRTGSTRRVKTEGHGQDEGTGKASTSASSGRKRSRDEDEGGGERGDGADATRPRVKREGDGDEDGEDDDLADLRGTAEEDEEDAISVGFYAEDDDDNNMDIADDGGDSDEGDMY